MKVTSSKQICFFFFHQRSCMVQTLKRFCLFTSFYYEGRRSSSTLSSSVRSGSTSPIQNSTPSHCFHTSSLPTSIIHLGGPWTGHEAVFWLCVSVQWHSFNVATNSGSEANIPHRAGCRRGEQWQTGSSNTNQTIWWLRVTDLHGQRQSDDHFRCEDVPRLWRETSLFNNFKVHAYFQDKFKPDVTCWTQRDQTQFQVIRSFNTLRQLQTLGPQTGQTNTLSQLCPHFSNLK